MRKLFPILMLLVIVLFLGCTSPVRDDLFNYINVKLPPITHLEKSALEEYQQIISEENYSSEVLYNSLKDNIIPKYSEFVNKLKGIKLSTEEVTDLHSLYLNGAEKQLESFIRFKEGIEQENDEMRTQGNENLQEAKDYMHEYQAKLIELAEKHNLKYELR